VSNTYEAFLNGSSQGTTLTTNAFSGGAVGLYDSSAQTFDNFTLSVVPEPSSVVLLAFGAAGLAIAARRKRLR
jgi:hypothetical protein